MSPRAVAWQRLREAIIQYRVVVRGSKRAKDPAAFALDYMWTDSWQANEIRRLTEREEQVRKTLRAARSDDVVATSVVVNAIACVLKIDLDGEPL